MGAVGTTNASTPSSEAMATVRSRSPSRRSRTSRWAGMSRAAVMMRSTVGSGTAARREFAGPSRVEQIQELVRQWRAQQMRTEHHQLRGRPSWHYNLRAGDRRQRVQRPVPDVAQRPTHPARRIPGLLHAQQGLHFAADPRLSTTAQFIHSPARRRASAGGDVGAHAVNGGVTDEAACTGPVEAGNE